MKLLIVDDVAVNRELLHATLEAEGHTVLQAADGQEALAVLEREPVDAVISDILMPNMDGFRLCHELRHREKLKHIALIHYTSTYTSPRDAQLSQSVGADGYLTKPVKTEELLRALNVAIHHAIARTASALNDNDATLLMKEYSVVLVKKLEEKIAKLEQAMAELRSAHAALDESNKSLEHRVQERTVELEISNTSLKAALSEVKELSGLLPICSSCKKIRDDDKIWHSVENYIATHTDAGFTHGICPDCFAKEMVKLDQ